MRLIRDLAHGAVSAAAASMLPRRPRVLIACTPKSASSFLADAVAALPRMRRATITYSVDWREHEIDTPRLAKHLLHPFVAQSHLRYSRVTGGILDRFNIVPVVQTRDLFDSVASVRDHIRNESFHLPMATLLPEHPAASDHELELLIAHLVMPWYISFFVGWLQRDDALWVNYEQIRTEPETVLAAIATRAGIRAGAREIAAAVETAKARRKRFNVGRSGRGADINPDAKEHIRRLAGHYPTVDFSPVGIS
jgi:hypothetical protein